MIMIGNDHEERKTLYEHLVCKFEMKDLEELKSRSRKGIHKENMP